MSREPAGPPARTAPPRDGRAARRQAAAADTRPTFAGARPASSSRRPTESGRAGRLAVRKPGKMLWPGISKADLAAHYQQVAARMLGHLRDRPLTLVRAPDGIEANRFFQKDEGHMPGVLGRCLVPGGPTHVMAEDEAALLALADQACVELHGWTSTCARPDQPDRIIFDLDPPDDRRFDDVRAIASALVGLLERRGARPHAMVTGSRGIHVVVPLVPEADFWQVAAFGDAVGTVMARHDPRITMAVRKATRGGRIFFDTLRNRPHQTSVLPWSTRARPGAPVATPIRLDELGDDRLDPQAWRVSSVRPDDPWRRFAQDACRWGTLTRGS